MGGAVGAGGAGGAISYNGSDTLLAYYRFDSSTGTTAVDSSGHARDGELGSNAAAPMPSWVDGKLGGGLELNGQNWVSVAYSPAWNEIEAKSAFTLAAFVRPSMLFGGWSMALSRQYNATALEHFGLGLHDSKVGGLAHTAPDPNRFCNASAEVALDVWVHMAATYDGSKLRVYQDGVRICDREVTGAVPKDDTQTGLIIGGNINNAALGVQETLTGAIDEVVLYSRALSETEIDALVLGVPPAE